MCGEHEHFQHFRPLETGSSPHVRGTHTKIEKLNHIQRFIPACAGNTYTALSVSSKMTVHPRMCGEHILVKIQRHLLAGSSPHVRGTQIRIENQISDDRFIPACAGNTTLMSNLMLRLAVHPRMCGEHDRRAVDIR